MSHLLSRPALVGLVAVITAALGIAIAVPPAAALDTNVGGNWSYNMSVSGLGSFSCFSQNQVSGSDFEMDISCNLVGSGILIGSYDKATGSIDAFGSIGGQQMQLFGSAPDDFNQSGTVSLSQSGSGTFSGFRDTPFVGGIAELTDADASPAAAPAAGSNAALIASAIGGVLLATLAGAFAFAMARRARG